MTDKDQSHANVEMKAVNDNRSNAVQSGEDEADTLRSPSDLIPLVRLLARQAAAEMFAEAANDNRRSHQEKRPKE